MNTARAIEQGLSGITIATDAETLGSMTADWWPLALLRRVRGDAPELPAAVVRPSSTEDVARVLAWASANVIAVVPRGGGSGVCGGAVAPQGSVVIDMRAMNRVREIDVESQIVHTDAGVLGDELEAALNHHGLMLGHYPQSFSLSTVGGWIAATSAGQVSPAFGFIEDHLLGATVVLADGTVVTLKPTPRSAAGPDLRRLFLGSEGTLGVITEAWLAATRFSDQVCWDSYRLPSFERCMDAARDIRRGGIYPRINRGWDEDDTRRGFAALGHQDGCVSVVGFTQGEPGTRERRDAAASIFRSYGGESIGSEPGALWHKHRFDAIRVFQDVMGPTRSLGSGVIIDTIEIAGVWSGLGELYQAVRRALLEHADEARCHFSHVYTTGACLYYTFILSDNDDTAVERRYQRTWESAARACLGAGGTLTHHHGMGRLKARFTQDELGAEATMVLRRIKAELDPKGILNPGALLPDITRPA
jgi:alkyldihydroxyacetonephosphate synthase